MAKPPQNQPPGDGQRLGGAEAPFSTLNLGVCAASAHHHPHIIILTCKAQPSPPQLRGQCFSLESPFLHTQRPSAPIVPFGGGRGLSPKFCSWLYNPPGLSTSPRAAIDPPSRTAALGSASPPPQPFVWVLKMYLQFHLSCYFSSFSDKASACTQHPENDLQTAASSCGYFPPFTNY